MVPSSDFENTAGVWPGEQGCTCSSTNPLLTPSCACSALTPLLCPLAPFLTFPAASHALPAEQGGLVLDVGLEYADPTHSVVLLAYIMRRRTRDQVKVGVYDESCSVSLHTSLSSLLLYCAGLGVWGRVTQGVQSVLCLVAPAAGRVIMYTDTCGIGLCNCFP